MKVWAIAGVVAAMVAVALLPVVAVAYGEAYPTDSARRAVLDGCATGHPGFDRWLAADRAACFAGVLNALPAKADTDSHKAHQTRHPMPIG